LRDETEKGISALRVETDRNFSTLRDETEKSISALRVETDRNFSTFRDETAKSISALRVELKDDINKLRTEMHAMKADLVRWVFVVIMGQNAMLLGVLYFFIRYFK
jgi:archaellum component FlaC